MTPFKVRKPEWPKWLRILPAIAAVAAIAAAVVGAIVIRCVLPPSCANLAYTLDQMFPNKGWFCFPDDNNEMIGIRRVPDGFTVRSPITLIDIADKHFGSGDHVFSGKGGRGGTGHLVCPIRDINTDCPAWQRPAIAEWRAARGASQKGINKAQLDEKFNSGNWECSPNKDIDFVAVANLKNTLHIDYPITTIDGWDTLKWGVGEVVQPGDGNTVWLAGPIPRKDCPVLRLRFVWVGHGPVSLSGRVYLHFGAEAREKVLETNSEVLFQDLPSEWIGQVLRLRLDAPTYQSLQMQSLQFVPDTAVDVLVGPIYAGRAE